MLMLRMAWRNIWRNKRRSVVTIAAVVLATLAAGLYPAWRACRTEPVESIKLV